jgi:hypothetical protein
MAMGGPGGLVTAFVGSEFGQRGLMWWPPKQPAVAWAAGTGTSVVNFEFPLSFGFLETSDMVPVLVDLARHGKYDDFRWLARASGVPESYLDELWAGTLRRVERETVTEPR